MCTCVGDNDGFKRGRGVVPRARTIMLYVYVVVTQTKTVYIVKTFEQLIHLFITMCAEKKMSVSQVIPSANRVLF